MAFEEAKEAIVFMLPYAIWGALGVALWFWGVMIIENDSPLGWANLFTGLACISYAQLKGIERVEQYEKAEARK